MFIFIHVNTKTSISSNFTRSWMFKSTVIYTVVNITLSLGGQIILRNCKVCLIVFFFYFVVLFIVISIVDTDKMSCHLQLPCNCLVLKSSFNRESVATISDIVLLYFFRFFFTLVSPHCPSQTQCLDIR